jgi:hypothetical protein
MLGTRLLGAAREMAQEAGYRTSTTTITNSAVIAASGHQAITRTATVRANWQCVYLPLVLKENTP